MAINANLLSPRQSDRRLFLISAIAFPLLVLIGYAKSYYFSAFFDVKPVANALVHAHGVVMSAWVLYFVAQVALIRSKNVKLHMTLGMAGVALAALVVLVGLATAYDAQLVRQSAPPGVDPHEFFILPAGDMLLFVIYFAGAIYYRKRPLEHKSLMLMTAINFLPAALFRIPLVPESYALLFTFGVPALMAIFCLVWLKLKHGKFNRIFAAAILLYLIALPFPFRMAFAETAIWHSFTNWLVS
ncbi:MAG TPA: hypothetical protein VK400_02275 [Pyrinomonadaceae bacterium]|nr:hypothetical protein [Pyrinomonadaceae bacterium]